MILGHWGLLFILVCLMFCLGCNTEQFPQGKRIFDFHCSNCHMNDGTGVGKLFPGMNESIVIDQNPSVLPCLIMTGRKSAKVSTVAMPPIKTLSAAEMNNLINYLVHSWGDQRYISYQEVEKWMADCTE
jgi:mono/diheme cytochrome c family protein